MQAKRTRELLLSNALIRTNRDYRLLLSASSVSNLGDGIAMVALPWLATMLTSDPLLIAGVATAQRLPWLLFALPAGVWTDRMDRRLLMVRADLVRVALMAFTVLMVVSQTTLPAPDGSGPAAILSLTLMAFLFGSAEVIRDNAAQTVLPSIVAHVDLERANGQMWSAEQITGQFIGPPLAGLLIASSVALPFGVDASAYAFSALLVWLIALPPRKSIVTTRFLPALLRMRWPWISIVSPSITDATPAIATGLGLITFCRLISGSDPLLCMTNCVTRAEAAATVTKTSRIGTLAQRRPAPVRLRHGLDRSS